MIWYPALLALPCIFTTLELAHRGKFLYSIQKTPHMGTAWSAPQTIMRLSTLLNTSPVRLKSYHVTLRIYVLERRIWLSRICAPPISRQSLIRPTLFISAVTPNYISGRSRVTEDVW